MGRKTEERKEYIKESDIIKEILSSTRGNTHDRSDAPGALFGLLSTALPGQQELEETTPLHYIAHCPVGEIAIDGKYDHLSRLQVTDHLFEAFLAEVIDLHQDGRLNRWYIQQDSKTWKD